MGNNRLTRFGSGIAVTFMMTAVLSAPLALAYRAAHIAADEVDVKASPDPNAATTGSMTQGTRVNTSDSAVNGFYRVRSVDTMGWVPATALDFGNGAPPPPASQAPRPETMGDQAPYENLAATPHPWAMKAFGGFDFFSPTDVNNVIGSTGLNSGTGYGAQLQYGLNANLALALRVEHIGKNASGSDSSGNTVDSSVASTPVMVGLEWMAGKGDSFSFDVGGFAGEGLSTQVSATVTNLSSPNVTTYSSSAPTLLLDADLNWMISEPFWIFGELGYRYLKTSNMSPSTTGNGSGIFDSPAGSGNLASLDVNLSGLVLNFGIRLNF